MKNCEFNIYTDLACERRRADTSVDGIEYKKTRVCCGIWEKIAVSSREGALSIGKPMGIYNTLHLPRMDLMDNAAINDAKDEIARELCLLCEKISVTPERILAVGLGNATLTPDAVGAVAADKIKPTMHIKSFDADTFSALECSEIAVILPRVSSQSGLDAIDTVKSMCDRLHPDVVFAIDALASRSADRLGATIQISTTGIQPGGGLGNPKKPLTEKTVGTPVIAIGVPTIMDSTYFAKDSKQVEGRSHMFVAPKEINDIVNVAGEIIADGINRAFGLCF